MGKYNLKDGTNVELIGLITLKLHPDTSEEQRIKFINEFNECEKLNNPNPRLLPQDFGLKKEGSNGE